ncbi:hypothetical protein KA977_10785, partial [Candidatus Dependentiae bacterium]|nr:hypothetical protein [Candidatus Dependentiae bacterium]
MKYYIVKTFLFAICFIIIFIPEYCSADTEPLNLNPLNLGNTANYSNDVNTGTSLNFKSVPEISILRLFLKVVAVLIIILVFFYIVRKVVSKKKMIYGGSNLFQTITEFQIGTNKSLHLVEFSNQIYLLGVT